METRVMRKATRTWSIFTRRWINGTASSLVSRAMLLGGAFLVGMIAA